jgi:hypothetical protein
VIRNGTVRSRVVACFLAKSMVEEGIVSKRSGPRVKHVDTDARIHADGAHGQPGMRRPDVAVRKD